MTVERAAGVGPAKIDVVYERIGDQGATPVVLVMGGTAQLIHWNDDFCGLLAARGFEVIRFDNRDAGLSTHFTSAPPVDFQAAMRGDVSTVPYSLSDMAADTVGLLDVLGIASAHFVGASQGGMIAQVIAVEHPARIRSLVSMMSTPRVAQPSPEVMAKVFSGGYPTAREEAADRRIAMLAVAGSPAYPYDEAHARAVAMRAFDRDHDLPSVVRQSAAVLKSGDRTASLRAVRCPTLVVHGLADALCPPQYGRETAAAIPGAELVEIEGMGHDLPRQLYPRIVELIATTVARGERA